MNTRKPSLRNNSFTECEMARGCGPFLYAYRSLPCLPRRFLLVIPDLIGDLEHDGNAEVRGEAVAEEQVGEPAF